MKRQNQKYRHKPEEGVYGDCYRTCFAILLDLDAEEVPHFCENGLIPAGEQDRLMGEWLLKNHGLIMSTIPFHGDGVCPADVYATLNAHSNGLLCIFSGMGKAGVNHSVVASGKGVVCDPSQTGSGIIGPCDDGFYWATFLVDKRFLAW